MEKVKQLEIHPYGFEYTPLENGKISVTEKERLRYTKSKPHVSFEGIDEYDVHTTFTEDFLGILRNDGIFTQMDMFGNAVIVTKEELIKMITDFYQY